jgi:hypothetical protein
MVEINREVVKDIGIIGAVFTLGACCGAVTGVGVVGGMIWSVSSAAFGGVAAAGGHKSGMHLSIVGVVGIAASIFGGACALKLAGLAVTFSAALLLSTTHAAIVLGVAALVALGFLVTGRVKESF